MDSSKSLEDDTIRDQMESGYVATRPRFTRTRRTWKINVRNLQAEDVRALDQFTMVTAARGGNAFLFPNLLPNGSFEFPACDATEVVRGWTDPAGLSQVSIAPTNASYEDGATAAQFSTVTGQTLLPHQSVTGQLNCNASVPCAAGDVYAFAGWVSQIVGDQAGILAAANGVSVTFYDGNGATVSTLSAVAPTVSATWTLFTWQFTAPAVAVSFSVQLTFKVSNSVLAVMALDGTQAAIWDSVGVSLLTPAQKYGRMAGSQPLGCPVRFSKLPETSDIGFGQGVKRYGANFELTEV
jgi:hypothetical protein